MQIVGFMDHETQSVFEVVAAVLKLGNIEFKPESRVNGLDESKIKDKNGKMKLVMGRKVLICLKFIMDFVVSVGVWYCRIIESLRLEKTTGII